MRGLPTILFKGNPSVESMRTGLLILSCNDAYGGKIAGRAREWLPHVSWTVVKRFEPGIPGIEAETIFSSSAQTIGKQLSFLRKLRKRKFDLVILACTNEQSYNAMKLMGVLTGYRSLVIFNENIDAYFASRNHHRTILNHIRWRLRDKRMLTGRHILLDTLSWVVLFPPAFVYLLLRTLYLVLNRRFRRA